MAKIDASDFEITDVSYKEQSVSIDEIAIDDDFLREYVAESFDVSVVFPENELRNWALNNGFKEE